MASFFGLLFGLLPPFLVLLKGWVVLVNGDAVVSGTVFCDQCKDGSRSFFDYPLYGATVAVSCRNEYREETTNFLGCYSVRFDGSPDLSGCYARVVRGTDECGTAVGPPQELKFLFRFFGMESYTVDPLLAQPGEPTGFCPRTSPSTKPWVAPPVALVPPPAAFSPPPPAPALPRSPAIPFLEASACSYEKWLMPEFRCYWRVVGPETPVAFAFGPVAVGKYGPRMTLWNGLHGRVDVYKTLLREATAALLNSYTSFSFPYPALTVVAGMNSALLGSQRNALMTALRFRRANSGVFGHSLVACKFTPCT